MRNFTIYHWSTCILFCKLGIWNGWTSNVRGTVQYKLHDLALPKPADMFQLFSTNRVTALSPTRKQVGGCKPSENYSDHHHYVRTCMHIYANLTLIYEAIWNYDIYRHVPYWNWSHKRPPNASPHLELSVPAWQRFTAGYRYTSTIINPQTIVISDVLIIYIYINSEWKTRLTWKA